MIAMFYHSPFITHKEPRVTVCGILQEYKDSVTITFGVSRCSRKDNFSRKKGRTIAQGRAAKNSVSTETCHKGEEKKCFYNRAEQLAHDFLNHPEFI